MRDANTWKQKWAPRVAGGSTGEADLASRACLWGRLHSPFADLEGWAVAQVAQRLDVPAELSGAARQELEALALDVEAHEQRLRENGAD
jgi:hypothetical protein